MSRTRTIAAALTLALLATTPALAQAQPPALDAQKRALVARVLELQQPGIENTARLITEQPALQLLQQAGIALQQRVPAERREAVAREIQAEARRYVEDTGPPVRQAALRLAPTTIGPILEARFSTEELRQLVAILESPAYRKLQQFGGDMQRALGEALVAEARPTVEPRLRALHQAIGERLNAAAAAPATPPPAR
jgi:hypothetical protein